MNLKLDIRISEKFTFEGFKEETPKIYENVNKLFRKDGIVHLYRDDEFLVSIEEFYYSIEVLKCEGNPLFILNNEFDDFSASKEVAIENRNVCSNSIFEEYMRKYYDILPKYNYLKHKLEERISIFDDNYTVYDLCDILWNIEFMEKFKKDVDRQWKNHKGFDALIERLKAVYEKADSVEKVSNYELYGKRCSGAV